MSTETWLIVIAWMFAALAFVLWAIEHWGGAEIRDELRARLAAHRDEGRKVVAIRRRR